ncbi:MAG TPA: response regulator transcription factor [Sedimentisphaerales bacterium]|jgi:DNA-binding response OmpR family regulator|nr:response regulator transcription factor [Sedimentisphaerales bacterium]
MTRILLVEDDLSLAMGLEDDLKLEGYQVQVARDGEAASRLALDEPFDLIVLDVMLPRKDGFEVCRELRRSGLRMPIIMLTAKTQDSDKVLGLELGADDYVTKPFNPRELRARIKAVLRRSGSELPELYSFGDVEVDFSRHEVRRAGKPVPLTHMEFRLLTALIRRRGRVLSRDQLLNDVWGLDSLVTDRAVDTHIANLRKKVERKPSHPRYLITVHGAGYRFDD